ncbi:MAG: hypothetical protein A3K68_08140 [Euryarchaeota archaeon RBG_16_68_13]|nr:MAG: hypothetical protein A3K68_08140 [Euryarchaeota archaeon RBG_16_68_13]
MAFPKGDGSPDPRDVVERLSPVVEVWSDLDSPGTDPGLVLLRRKPPPSLYWSAVRGIVDRRHVEGMPPQAASFVDARRDLAPGWYEPPVGSRRHLSKPLRRGAPRVRTTGVP